MLLIKVVSKKNNEGASKRKVILRFDAPSELKI